MSPTALPYQRILVPYDGSETAERGLMEALTLARRLAAQLRLLMVLDTYPPRRDQMRRQLEDARARLIAFGVATDVRVFDGMDGALADFIALAATEWPADAVVMGTHGRGSFAHLIMGSDADAVTRASPVPVLVVPPRRSPAPPRRRPVTSPSGF